MTEEELVTEIKQCVDRLNQLSQLAGEMDIEFEFDDHLTLHHLTGGCTRHVTIKKRLA